MPRGATATLTTWPVGEEPSAQLLWSNCTTRKRAAAHRHERSTRAGGSDSPALPNDQLCAVQSGQPEDGGGAQNEPSGARWRVLQRVLVRVVLFLAPISWGSERRGAGRHRELARPPRSPGRLEC